MSGLKISDLSLRYGKAATGFQALDNINLDIESGTFVTLLGPSGSGKTTLLRCIAGLATPTAGSIVAGQRLFYEAKSSTGLLTRYRNLGMVFQAFALWPHMTAEANIGFPLKLRGWPTDKRRARVDELLEIVGLPGLGGRYPSQLSGGQQQRVGLARAIAGEPSVLLMDEPLSSLDARLREEMRAHIRRIQKELGITVVYVTHDREEALGLSDVVVILSRGKIVSTGKPKQLYGAPPDAFTATFLSGWNLLGDVDVLAGRPDGQWLKRVERPAQCNCGGRCAVLLPVETSDSLSEGAGSGDATVNADVVGVEFLGSCVRVELRLPGVDHPAFVTQYGPAAERAAGLAKGSPVALPVDSFRVLCRPDAARLN